MKKFAAIIRNHFPDNSAPVKTHSVAPFQEIKAISVNDEIHFAEITYNR